WVTVAHHYERAARWADAGAWNLAAARWAQRWDARALVEQLRRAIMNLDRTPRSAEVLRLRLRARAQLVRNAFPGGLPRKEADRIYKEGLALARQERDFGSHAELVLSYGVEKLHRGHAEAAATLTAEAARLAHATGLHDGASEFASYVLFAHNHAGRLE